MQNIRNISFTKDDEESLYSDPIGLRMLQNILVFVINVKKKGTVDVPLYSMWLIKLYIDAFLRKVKTI